MKTQRPDGNKYNLDGGVAVRNFAQREGEMLLLEGKRGPEPTDPQEGTLSRHSVEKPAETRLAQRQKLARKRVSSHRGGSKMGGGGGEIVRCQQVGRRALG